MSFRRISVHTLAVCMAALLLALPAQSTDTALGKAVVADILYQVQVGGSDLMSTKSRTELAQFPSDGQIYYLPRNVDRAWYRSFNGRDHMDTGYPGEGGYANEGMLGGAYGFASYSFGLERIIRTYNPTTGDHGIRSSWAAQRPGYQDEPSQYRNAWPRFGHQGKSMLVLQAGDITVESNRVAGGAIARWWHNGTQYINNRGYGLMMQSSFFHAKFNPTEAGDRYGDSVYHPPQDRHGSPLIAAYNDGNTQVTRAVPVEFEPEANALGGGIYSPVIWKDMYIGKNLTLKFAGLPDVAKYTTVIRLPNAVYGAAEIPTGYLRAEFNKFWTYDAASQTLQDVTSQVVARRTCGGDLDPGAYRFSVNFGGIIISNLENTKAMGVYAVHTAHGGSATSWAMWDFRCDNDGIGEQAFDSTKWQVEFRGNFAAAPQENHFNAYVISGSRDSVRHAMNLLYGLGVR